MSNSKYNIALNVMKVMHENIAKLIEKWMMITPLQNLAYYVKD